MSSPVISGRIASVTDGDTFRLASGERIRIADIDAPETRRDQAKCPAELALGKAVSKRARALLTGQDISFIRSGKSWKRTVAIVTWRGGDLGTTLIANGIARPWPRHYPKPDWCG